MKDLNLVAVIGRLTRDSEMKFAGNNQAVCKFSVAVNRSRKNGDHWEDEASFFNITLFGKQGEAINKYLLKGTRVAIEGELKQERWEQDGIQRSTVGIIANNVQLLGSKDGEQKSDDVTW